MTSYTDTGTEKRGLMRTNLIAVAAAVLVLTAACSSSPESGQAVDPRAPLPAVAGTSSSPAVSPSPATTAPATTSSPATTSPAAPPRSATTGSTAVRPPSTRASATPTPSGSSAPATDASATTTASLSTKVDPKRVDRKAAVDVALGFVTLFAERSVRDSQANNFALRSAPLATPALAERLAQQARTDPQAYPSAGSTEVTITAADPLPKGATADRVPVRVTYSVQLVANGQTVNRLDAVSVNCVVVRQARGTWLVDDVSTAAN